MDNSQQLSVSSFVKMLTGAGFQITRAMELTSKLFKLYNTPELLERVTDAKLCELGITRKDERKQILKAFAKSKPGNLEKSTKQRKPRPTRDRDLLDRPPSQEVDECVGLESLDFKEITDEAELEIRSTVVNRAPIMTAWAMVVAERLGFKREEALSIASAYTELNAISKGTSLGIMGKGKTPASEVMESNNQPHIGRTYGSAVSVYDPITCADEAFIVLRIPLLTGKNSQWRALSSDGSPVPPSTAYSYVSNAMRQTAPYIIGAMRLLAATFTSTELNQKGFGLYASFRPQVESWGGRSAVKCKDILALRKQLPHGQSSKEVLRKFTGKETGAFAQRTGLSLEEYEAALNQDESTVVDLG